MAQRQVTFLINANVKNFTKGMDSASKRFKKFGRNMQQMGRNLTQSITAPVLAIGAGAVKMAVDFESAFAGVRKTVDATEGEFAGLRKGILEMSKTLPTTATEIAAVAEAAGQLGIATENILEFSRTMVMLGDTTNLTANEAATSFARIANVMQLPQDQFDEMGSVVVDLGNNFATTEAEIVEFGNRIAGAGKIAGLTAPQVFAIGTALSSVGIKAESGGTAVQKALLNMNDAVARGGKSLQVFAETAGMTADQFQTRWRDDAGAAFTAFVNGLGKEGDNATRVLDQVGLNSERTRATFLSLAGAGDLLNRTINTGNEAWDENSALTKEAQQRYDTVAAKIQMVKNRIIALGISIGEALMPAFEAVIEFTEKLTISFENLSADAKVNALKMAALFAAGGPIMWAIGTFAKAISGLVLFVKTKFALITLAFVAGVGVGQSFLDNWAKVAAGFEIHMRVIEQAATQTVLAIIKIWKKWFNTITSIAPPEFLTAIFGIDLSEMALNFTGVNKLIKDLEGNVESNGKDIEDAVIRYYEKPWVGFFESTKTGIGAVTTAFMGMVRDVTSETALVKFLESLGGTFEETAETITKTNNKVAGSFDQMTQKSLGLETIEERLNRLSEKFQNMDVTLDNSMSKWEKFKKAFKAIGEEFKDFLAKEMTTAVLGFGEALGKSLAGVDNKWQTSFEKIIMVVIDFAQSLARLAAAIGGLMLFMPGLAGVGAGLLAAAAVLQTAVSAAKGSIQKKAAKRQERAGMANGGVVPSGFPNDSYPAMLSSGETVIPSPKPLPSMSMGGKIEVPVYLNDREIARAMSDYTKDLSR